jgi:uncharacterized protein
MSAQQEEASLQQNPQDGGASRPDQCEESDLAVHVPQIAGELKIAVRQIIATAQLLGAGSTVPFIARYRKEVTGGLDEVAVIAVRDRLAQLRDLASRRAAILASLAEQGKLTDELKSKVAAAPTMTALEDIYLPFRPKRRTRGTIAKDKGLEPLARLLFEQGGGDVIAIAATYVNAEKGVADAEAALAGARDIIAEWVNEDAAARTEIRDLFASQGVLKTHVITGKEAEGIKYKDYYDWSEPISKAPSHRILAIRRGEKEGMLAFDIQPDAEQAISRLERRFIKSDSPAALQVRLAIADSYKRLMSLSIETDLRMATKKRADEEAIAVFAGNLRELLLASPLGQKRMLAIDPGQRTGCKIVVLDRQGKLLHHDVIYIFSSDDRKKDAAAMVRFLCQKFQLEAIAIGNGTGGRETEAFCRELALDIPIVSVNESGASIYSASEVAREEFPDLDLTVRGAASIGRRLMDPLAELVKIDPKSIGVGQYQHDVDQGGLKKSLDDVVTSCVSSVGVEVNTASKQLLSYVSGLGPKVAGNIVARRDSAGPFASRRQLLEVPGMGPKTFEQSAGFLRIRQSDNPLDASAVHPESYPIVQAMAADLGCTVADLIANPELRSKINLSKYVTDTVGMPTLTDILAELAKPGRDPRKEFEAFNFAQGVQAITDLSPGMKLPGIVTNVAAFGAFVDVGVHQDGLVHISELADHFVKNPAEVVKVGQKVTVTVLSVDLERKRIALSLRTTPGAQRKPAEEKQAKPQAPQAHRPPNKPAPRASAPAPSGWFSNMLKTDRKGPI